MSHKITIEIESEKEWAAVCALSSLLKKPLSELSKKYLMDCTESLASRISEDEVIMKELSTSENSVNIKRLVAIIN